MTTTPAPTDHDTLKADIKQAHDEICNIAEGKRRWTMSIPAKEATDSDLVISRALAGAERVLDELAIALPFLRDGALAEHHGKCGESSQWDIRRCEDAHCLERAHLLEAHGLIPEEWDTYPIPEANPATTAEPADDERSDTRHPYADDRCGLLGPALGLFCQLRPGHTGGHRGVDPVEGEERTWPNPQAEPADEPKADEPKPRTCRECGHTADDHHPAEGSIRPIGCQRLDCDCSFTLLDIEVKP